MRVLSFSPMRKREKLTYRVLVSLWILVNAIFWLWWFRPRHIANPVLYILMSVALLYEGSVLPSFYLFFLGKMRVPLPINPEKKMKVAMITLCVPSRESLDVIERQLEAMVNVEYPHDSWVLDEGADPQVKELARKYGVRYFSRKGNPQYNQEGPPFQKKTKAGNVNAWIEEHGSQYDYFTQLDIDHVPEEDYLDKVLGYFRDPQVAWVQAPSVYGNFEHWAARGSAEQELVLQGPLQMGFFGYSETPFIIGSHSTYRMSAIKEIGGFQPTRAEDHLDTVVLAGRGYRGVFVPEVIAVGDGPESFDTYLGQQFAWAYSMIQVLFKHTPKHILKYRKNQRVQFLFAQTWYMLWSTTMGLLFLLPIIALLTVPITRMAFGPFLLRYLPLPMLSLVMWFWSLRRGWFRPRGLSLSWRGVVLHMARWPIVLWALINVLLGIRKPYMITKKGLERGEDRPFTLRSQIPYVLLMVASFFAAWLFILRGSKGDTQGYLIFVLEGILLMLVVYTCALFANIAETYREGVSLLRTLYLRLRAVLLLYVLVVSLVLTVLACLPAVQEAVAWAPPVERENIYVVNVPMELQHGAVFAKGIDEPYREHNVDKSYSVPRERAVLGLMEVSDGLFLDVEPITVTPHLAPTPTPTRVPAELPSGVAVGAYDPYGGFEELALDIEHAFVPWYLTEDFENAVKDIRSRKRFPLISVEPWPYLEDGLGTDTLLQDTNAGDYDVWIKALAEVVKNQDPQVIMIRWGHEMELTGLYPWSTEDAHAYISAYRRFVDLFREVGADNVLWVWSPGGNSGAEQYYPGDDYVDYVGITILADEYWDALAGFSELRSFEALLSEKYWVVDEFGKPLIVAEFGVSGGVHVRERWFQGVLSGIYDFPELRGLVYFNAVNTHMLADGYRPEWQVTEDMFREYMISTR